MSQLEYTYTKFLEVDEPEDMFVPFPTVTVFSLCRGKNDHWSYLTATPEQLDEMI
jgi:hypothetical protein